MRRSTTGGSLPHGLTEPGLTKLCGLDNGLLRLEPTGSLAPGDGELRRIPVLLSDDDPDEAPGVEELDKGPSACAARDQHDLQRAGDLGPGRPLIIISLVSLLKVKILFIQLSFLKLNNLRSKSEKWCKSTHAHASDDYPRVPSDGLHGCIDGAGQLAHG